MTVGSRSCENLLQLSSTIIKHGPNKRKLSMTLTKKLSRFKLDKRELLRVHESLIQAINENLNSHPCLAYNLHHYNLVGTLYSAGQNTTHPCLHLSLPPQCWVKHFAVSQVVDWYQHWRRISVTPNNNIMMQVV